MQPSNSKTDSYGTGDSSSQRIAGYAARYAAGPVLCVMFALGAGSDAQLVRAGKVEPNDTLATATVTGLVGLGNVTIDDAFVGNGDWPNRDVDVYSFEIPPETLLPVFLTVEVVSDDENLDAFVRLFDADGLELANNDDRAANDTQPLIETYLLSPGVHYVAVSSTGNPFYDPESGDSGMPGTTGNYSLMIATEQAALPASPFEPNDSVNMGTDMGASSFEVTGEFIGDGPHGRRDMDVYILQVAGPMLIDVEVRAASIGSVLDPIVRVRQCVEPVSEPTFGDECLLGANDDATNGTTDSMLSIGIPSGPPSGMVFITVSGAGNPKYDPTLPGSGDIGSVGFYDLIVTVTSFEGAGINEPNDSAPTATPVELSVPDDQTVIEGFLGDGPYAAYRGDRDFYVIELPATGAVTATIDTESMGGGLDPILAVYDRTGLRILAKDNNQGSLDTSITFPVACLNDDGETDAFLMVMGSKQRFPNDPHVPNPEVVRLEEHEVGDGPGTTGPYSLSLSFANQCGDEPDDTMSLATDTFIGATGVYVCAGGVIGDGILCDDPVSDVDMWLVEVEAAPATLRVRIPCRDSFPAPGIRVFDAEGIELATSFQPFDPDDPVVVEIQLDVAGTYFVGVAYDGNTGYDPSKECSSTNTTGPIPYDIIITLEQTLVDNTASIPGGSDAPVGGGKESELFATRLSDAANTIDVLDPVTGDVTASFPAPEPIFSGAEAITSDGESLYYMGIGRYPNLYRMNPSTGDVLDEYILWSGSGFYSDAAVMGDELFVTDYMDRAVHVFNLTEETSARTLDVGLANGITIGGGLAAMAAPPRLYVADAFNTGAIFEVHPQTGAIVATLPAPRLRPTALGAIANELLFVSDWQGSTVEVLDRAGQGAGTLTLDGPIGSMGAAVTVDFLGDFDADGDIDLLDVAAFWRCFTGLSEPLGPGCAPGDFDENGSVDALDVAAFGAGLTGP